MIVSNGRVFRVLVGEREDVPGPDGRPGSELKLRLIPAHAPDEDARRAAALTDEFPPTSPVRLSPCGGCG